MLNGVRNEKHVFSSLPVVITENDAKRYKNGKGVLFNHLDNLLYDESTLYSGQLPATRPSGKKVLTFNSKFK